MKKIKVDAYAVVLHLAVIGLCVTTLLLAQENRKLRSLITSGNDAGGPQVGQTLEDLRWQPLDGEEVTVDFASGGQEHLLLIFTTDCPACQKNQAAWRTLHQRAGSSVEVLGISLSDPELTRGYRDTHSLPFPVGVPAEPQAFASAFEITGVPMTIRVGADGRVSGTWSGLLLEDRLDEITAPTANARR